MKILLLFTYNRSLEIWDRIGIFNREVALYKLLLKRNVEITFLTYGGKSDLRYCSSLSDINILPINNLIRSSNRWIRFLKSLLLAFKLRKELKSVDIIKSNQLEGSWVAWIGKIFYRKKLIIRGGFEWLKFYTLKRINQKHQNLVKFWLGYFWRYFIEFVSYKLADRIIITNQVDIEFITQRFKLKKKKHKIHLLYNFIDTDLFKPLNLDKYEKRVLFIGRIHPQKNLMNLIEAFRYLDGFLLDIIGEGPLKNKLSDIADTKGVKINFLGKIPNIDLPALINKYPIFILPSYYEGNPKVLLEAMACGAACIGTNVRGIKNIISHQDNGYLCEITPKSISDAIMTLYNSKSLIEQIGKNARQFILLNCSLETILNEEYSIYKNILRTS